MRQPGELGERAAAEVEAVELDFAGGVGEREGHDEAAQHGRLAALRAARDGDVAAGRGEVHHERLAALVEGLVDEADGDPQLAGAQPAGRGQAAHRVDGEAAEEFVERGGGAERRQPHPVGGRPGVAQPVQGHRQQGAALLLFLRLGLDGGRCGGAGHDVPGGPGHHLGGDPGLGDGAAAPAVGAGDVGGAEPGEGLDAALEVAAAGLGGQFVGVGDAEDAPGLHRGEGAQTDPVRQVRLELVHTALVQSLRGEQQVHAERPAEAADHHEQLHELAVRGEEFAELVDDDEEAGQRVEGGAGGAGPLVLQGGGVVAGRPQQFLAADQFAVQGVLHALDEGGLVGEVGDDGAGVREFVQAEEGGAALEVDEDEVEVLGGVGQGEAEDEGAQQLGLAGAGGADQHAVRAHAALCGLLDVEFDGASVGADGDRDPQPGGAGVLAEQGLGFEAVQVGDAEEGGELHVGEQRLDGVGGEAHPVGGDEPGERFGGAGSDLVGAAEDGGLLLAAAVGADQGDGVGGDVEAQRGASRPPGEGAGEVQDDGVAVAGAVEAVAGRDARAVHDDHDERLVTAGCGVRVEGGPLGELAAELVLQVGEGGGDHAQRAGAVGLLRVLVVGEPFQPFPLGAHLVVGADRDPHLLRRVEQRQLAQCGAEHGAGGVPVAAHQHA